MGLVYSSTESSQLMQAVSFNLKSGRQTVEQLKSGSQNVLSAVDGKTLSGSAYTAGKRLFSELIIPTISKVTTSIDAIEQELKSYQFADRAVSSEGYLDEDNLNQQIAAKKVMKSSVDTAVAVVASIAKSTSVLKIADGLLDTQRELNDMSNSLQYDIVELERKLEKLHQFSSETNGLFNNSLNNMKIAMQSVLVLNNTVVNSDGSYILPEGTDRSLFTGVKGN